MLVFVIPFLVLACSCAQGLHPQVTHTLIVTRDRLENNLVSLLREQEAKWASVLQEQNSQLADLTKLLLEQGEKLLHQEDLLRQQGEKLLHQEDLLRHQEQKLSRQENLLQQQGVKMSYQEALLKQQGRVIQQLKARYSESHSVQNIPYATNTSQPRKHVTNKTVEATSHDVISRSDDTGPLGVVVSHISQQVMQMGADMQAFKTQTSADIQTLKNSNRQQDLAIQDAQSSTFVHWGSSTCTSLSHTVYSGVVGGSWWKHSGAATNYLCLTMSPVLSDHPIPAYTAYLYGGEYDTGGSYQNKDAVCAVCRSTLSTTVMIPGTNVCTPGWHLQYSGFLMAGGYDNDAGSQYICVDSKLESTAHSDVNQDGKLLFYTVSKCGSLPCSPYVDNKVVTCAVCSQ